MSQSAQVAEARNAELIRAVLLHLSDQQRSPPEAIFVSLADLAARADGSGEDVARALDFLRSAGWIDGPGWFEGEFLFRNVTAKGRALAQAIAHPRDWKAIKARYLA